MKGKRVLKKQKKQPNNSLLGTYFTSLFSVLLCFVMLLGTTFAWFHTGNTSAGNEINSGRLKVDMRHVTSDGKISLAEQPTHAVFSSNEKWTPGRTQIETVEVLNTGNVDLVYRLDFVPDPKRSTQQDVSGLFSVYVKADTATTRERGVEYGGELEDMEWTELGTLDEVMSLKRTETKYLCEGDVLKPGEKQVISIAIYMTHPDDPGAVMSASIPLYLRLEAIQPVAQEENLLS